MGKLVRMALDQGKRLEELDLDVLQTVSPAFQTDVTGLLSVQDSTEARGLPGGTGRKSVMQQTARGWKLLAERVRKVEI